MGGSLTESGLPTTPHMHYVSHTMHLHCVGRAVHFVSLTAHCVNRTKVWQETFSQHQVQNFFFWHFLRWKNKFFQNSSKLPKNHFITIKILFFFQIFRNCKSRWVLDQIWKIPGFFLNPSLIHIKNIVDWRCKDDISGTFSVFSSLFFHA